jgi:serine/threonine-protein kinase
MAEAEAEYRRACDLGQPHADWPGWFNRLRRLADLDVKLPAILSGKTVPANAAEQVELADLCMAYKKLNVAAFRFYTAAFAADPKLVDDLEHGQRYNAACAAALAGCGQGKDADKLDETERSQLRRQALDWLTADLTAWAKIADQPAELPKVRPVIQHWLEDPDLAGVRGDAIAKLPEAERPGWQKLWADVEALLKTVSDAEPTQPPAAKP